MSSPRGRAYDALPHREHIRRNEEEILDWVEGEDTFEEVRDREGQF